MKAIFLFSIAILQVSQVSWGLLSAFAAKSLSDPRHLSEGRKVLPKRPSLKSLGLRAPEVEAKLLVPSKAIFKQMKELVGQELAIRDRAGRERVFQIKFDNHFIYEDRYFDAVGPDGSLALYELDSLLRQRTRYDGGSKGWKSSEFRYSNFQAKNAASDGAEMNSSVMARNEIRGKKYRSPKKFRKVESRLLRYDPNNAEPDTAIQYARDMLEYTGEFEHVLTARQKRFFMKLTPKGEGNEEVPEMFLSLDRVDFEGKVGKQSKKRQRVVELEIIDDLTLDAPKVASYKMDILNQVEEALKERYGLEAAGQDKYAAGVKSTIRD